MACGTHNWEQEVTIEQILGAGGLVLMTRRSGHPVARLDPHGPAVQLEVSEILLDSVPKASICCSTEAERTTDIAELSLDVASQGHRAHPTTPATSTSMILS